MKNIRVFLPRDSVVSSFQVLRNETLIIDGYKAIWISIFHLLVVKLWLREDDDLQK